MIDAHIHVVPPRLPGVGPLHPRLEEPAKIVADWLRSEMRGAGVSQCLAMGAWNAGDDDPLGVGRTLSIADHAAGLHAIGVCDPSRPDPGHLRAADRVLAAGRVKGLKVYLGYLHFEPAHANYRPYYELAEHHGVPVVFHCGDTYSPFAKLKFAHPLGVDEVAVDHPRVRFVLAHLGNPWLTDAAEVVYKNVNVWADLSGLLVGESLQPADEETTERYADLRASLLTAFRYAERPNRFVYGSDWPLVPLDDYRRLIAGWFPDALHGLLFEDNARVLFRL